MIRDIVNIRLGRRRTNIITENFSPSFICVDTIHDNRFCRMWDYVSQCTTFCTRVKDLFIMETAAVMSRFISA